VREEVQGCGEEGGEQPEREDGEKPDVPAGEADWEGGLVSDDGEREAGELTGEGIEEDGVCACESGDDREGGSDGGEDALDKTTRSFQVGDLERSVRGVSASEVELVKVVLPVGCGAETLPVCHRSVADVGWCGGIDQPGDDIDAGSPVSEGADAVG